MAADRADVAAREDPLLDLVEALDGRRGIRVLEGERFDRLDARLAQRLDDAGDRGRDRRVCRQPQAIAAARQKGEANQVLLGLDLLLHRGRWRRRRSFLLLAPEKRHVTRDLFSRTAAPILAAGVGPAAMARSGQPS